MVNKTLSNFNLAFGCLDLDPANKLVLFASTDSTQNPGKIEEAGETRQTVPAPPIHCPNYPYGFRVLPLNFNVGSWVKLASLVQFFFAIWLYVLYLFFVNPFLSCLKGIDSFSTSTTTE